ncbi:hypothetical protein TNCV_3418451 [Trichonephila clavipes]|nr:hypothetical protein TNCV_3418451 [Trichonephila clavipes]
MRTIRSLYKDATADKDAATYAANGPDFKLPVMHSRRGDIRRTIMISLQNMKASEERPCDASDEATTTRNFERTTKGTLQCNHRPTVRENTPPRQKRPAASITTYLRLRRAETQTSHSTLFTETLSKSLFSLRAYHCNMFKEGSFRHPTLPSKQYPNKNQPTKLKRKKDPKRFESYLYLAIGVC